MECDVWAFGCIAYKLMTGNEAFVNENLNQMEVFDNIKSEKYSLSGIDDPVCKNLISGILKQDVKERFTINTIKDSPFFNDVEFEDILKDNFIIFQEEEWLKDIQNTNMNSNQDSNFSN